MHLNNSHLELSSPSKKHEFKEIIDDVQIPNDFYKLCKHHDEPLLIYCETCQEPICKNCSLLGPHNNQLHRITSLQEAYERLSQEISYFIKENLFEKRELIIAQIYRIEYRIDEIKHVKNMIDRDARKDYSETLENLKGGEGEKVAVLEKEISDLQKDLDSLNDLGNHFMEISSKLADPINFILNSRNIYEKLQYLISKPFKQIIDVNPNDLPRELTDKRIKLEQNQAYKQLIRYKDALILKINIMRQEKMEKRKKELGKKALELTNLATKLTNDMADKLKKYHFVCYYCGAASSQKTVNKKCDKNSKIPPKEFIGFTKKLPYPKYHGNLQHFFAFPNEFTRKNVKSIFLDENLDKNEQKNLENEKKNLKTFMEIQIAKIRKTVIEKTLKLEELLKNHDKASTGKINYIQFSYILCEHLNLESSDIEQFINILDPDGKKFISYDLFLHIINNSHKIEELLKKYYGEIK